MAYSGGNQRCVQLFPNSNQNSITIVHLVSLWEGFSSGRVSWVWDNIFCVSICWSFSKRLQIFSGPHLSKICSSIRHVSSQWLSPQRIYLEFYLELEISKFLQCCERWIKRWFIYLNKVVFRVTEYTDNSILDKPSASILVIPRAPLVLTRKPLGPVLWWFRALGTFSEHQCRFKKKFPKAW